MKNQPKIKNIETPVSIQRETQETPCRIAICGIRGVPACYGGFETFAEELATRLVKKGYEVVVYGRKHVIDFEGGDYKGVKIRLLRAPQHKYFETPVHTLLSLLDLIKNRVDVVLVCNAANSPFVWLPRLFGMPVAVNLDGIERHRTKWNFVGRLWYRLGELCSVLFSSEMIADAHVIRDYYQGNYWRSTRVIAYGYAETDEESVEEKIFQKNPQFRGISENPLFSELGIEPGKYLLYVSRLEPENNAHVVIDAYNRLSSEEKKYPLLIVGDAPYAQEYIASLHELAQEQIIFAGFRFGEAYRALQVGAYLYIQATEVGGTHPALVEAMGFGNAILANKTPENEEVLADGGELYKKNDVCDLSNKLRHFIGDREHVAALRKRARKRAQECYCWDKIVSDYEELFRYLLQRK